MSCNKCNKHGGCDCGCGHDHKHCNKVLEKYHCLINKSNDLYEEAVEEQSEAIRSVVQAIRDLEEFKCLFIKSYEVYDAANELLEDSNCCFDCNINSCKCEKLGKISDELYYKQFAEVNEALEALKAALCSLKEATEYGLEADEVYEEYTKCIHKK